MFKKVRSIIALLLIIALILPAWAVSDQEIEQAKDFVKTPQGQELLKEIQPQSQPVPAEQTQVAPAATQPQPEIAAAVAGEISVVENAFNKNVKQFGYDVFRDTTASFAPSGDTPVGPDYLIGPGDAFNVTLWGAAEGVFRVDVDRQGTIVLPKVGQVSVAGLTYGDLKPTLERELAKYYEKINIGISIANLRTIRVFIVGEVNRPGSYSISSLATLFNALFIAGGPTKKGTLRDIELKRDGRTIAHIDLYNFLLYGDKSQDHSLQSGDTIYVPIIGPTVGINGNVYRPAIYEIKGSADLADIIALAGGVLPTTYLNRVQIERVVAHEKKMVLDKKITVSSDAQSYGIKVMAMDFINIYGIYSAIGNLVILEGNVKYPGPYEIKENSRVRNIITSPELLTFNAYLPKAEIVRISKDTLKTEIISLNLQQLFDGDENQNIPLESGDRIVVRSEQKDEQAVQVRGEVKLPGTYTITQGEHLSSVLKRAGGLTNKAYWFGTVFTRQSAKIVQEKAKQKMLDQLSLAINEQTMGSQNLSVEVANIKSQVLDGRVVIKLSQAMQGGEFDLELEDGDQILIPAIPKTINVVGEVYQPGSLVYVESRDVNDYLARLGGMTKDADHGRVYIYKADGSVLSADQGYNIMALRLNPGDTIIVPRIIDKVDIYARIGDFTKWLFEFAAVFAVIKTATK